MSDPAAAPRASTFWDPAAYLSFDDHRARPFHDLLNRVSVRAPRRVVDLGCGPGTRTAELPARWPDARVEGLDSSAEMVAAARERGVDARLVDVADWTPAPDTDVVLSNAVLHWVPQHRELLPRWVAALPAVEVHLSAISAREEWRKLSVISELCETTITGRGPEGYRDALDVLRPR